MSAGGAVQAGAASTPDGVVVGIHPDAYPVAEDSVTPKLREVQPRRPKIHRNANPDNVGARWTRMGQPIGRGGFGTVWRVCESSSAGNEAALKVVDVPALLRSGIDQAQLDKDLLRELEIMGKLSHKNITCMIEAFIETSGVVHLVMELCRGPTLQWVLDRRGALTEPEAQGIMQQLLDAVMHMHAQLTMHRDLKPDNVMFTSKLAETWREPGALQNADIKILDFGLARPLVAMSGSVHGGTVRALSSPSRTRDRRTAARCSPARPSPHSRDGSQESLPFPLAPADAMPPLLQAYSEKTRPSALVPTPENSLHDGSRGAFGNLFRSSSCESPGDSNHGGRSLFFGPSPARKKSRDRNLSALEYGEASPGNSLHGGSRHGGSLHGGGSAHSGTFFSLTEGVVSMDGSQHKPSPNLAPREQKSPPSPGSLLRRRLSNLPKPVNVTPVGTRLYSAPELKDANTASVSLSAQEALATDVYSLGRIMRYMLVGLPPHITYQTYLEGQSMLMPLLRPLLRLATCGKCGNTTQPTRVVVDPASLGAEAKGLMNALLSKNPQDRPVASAARTHSWLTGGGTTLAATRSPAPTPRRPPSPPMSPPEENASHLRRPTPVAAFCPSP